MSELIEEWKKRKNGVRDQHRKLLTKLSKSNKNTLNELADKIHDSVFEKISCLDCANCCKSIPPLINETDIRRISKFLGQKTSQFMSENITVDEDGDMVFNQSPCRFLAADNKCEIYEVRPRACRQYPHTNNFEFSKHMKIHLPNAEYCPAVFHILERLKNI